MKTLDCLGASDQACDSSPTHPEDVTPTEERKADVSPEPRVLSSVCNALEVDAATFASAAATDPSIVEFLGIPTVRFHTGVRGAGEDAPVTLRAALHELGGGKATGGGRGGERGGTVRWGDIEEILFERYDPTRIFCKPPICSKLASRGRAADKEVRLCLRTACEALQSYMDYCYSVQLPFCLHKC